MPDKKPGRCLIIGPMRDEADADGLRWLQRFARSIIQPLLDEIGLPYDVITPYELTGSDIMVSVISEIDRTDFVIADLTDYNPNVMYELSLAHGLGRPCMTIGTDKPPFDLGGLRHIFLAQDTLPSALAPDIRTQLLQSLRAIHKDVEDEEVSINPITRFYGAPLTGVSSTTAVAHTYFVNFIQPFVKIFTALNNDNDEYLYPVFLIERDEQGKQVLIEQGKTLKDRAKLKLHIIIPERLEFTDLEQIRTTRGPDRGKLRTASVSAPHRQFTVLARQEASSLQFYDFATPMNGLGRTVERRMKGLAINRESTEFRELEAEEINRFYNALIRMIGNNPELMRGRVEVLRFNPQILSLKRDVVKTNHGKLLWLYDILLKR
jgi:hypothetical protein